MLYCLFVIFLPHMNPCDIAVGRWNINWFWLDFALNFQALFIVLESLFHVTFGSKHISDGLQYLGYINGISSMDFFANLNRLFEVF
jgi:hypothetical protein